MKKELDLHVRGRVDNKLNSKSALSIMLSFYMRWSHTSIDGLLVWTWANLPSWASFWGSVRPSDIRARSIPVLAPGLCSSLPGSKARVRVVKVHIVWGMDLDNSPFMS